MLTPDGPLVFTRSGLPRSGQDPSPGDDNTHLFLPVLPNLSLIFYLLCSPWALRRAPTAQLEEVERSADQLPLAIGVS